MQDWHFAPSRALRRRRAGGRLRRGHRRDAGRAHHPWLHRHLGRQPAPGPEARRRDLSCPRHGAGHPARPCRTARQRAAPLGRRQADRGQDRPRGRLADRGPEPAAGARGLSQCPRELTLPEIDELVAAFAQAARRALSVGFEIVEIHGAHGYLTHSFFSPHSNKRSDEFGGSLEKRMRFPLLVAEAVRAVWPAEKPVFYRASVDRQYRGRASRRGQRRPRQAN